MHDADAAVDALAARIAAGEVIDITTLPPELRARPLVQRLLRFARLADAMAGQAAAEPAAAGAPERIGPWRLVRAIGSGGMGDVWLGERSDGTVEHRVAIKRVRGASAEFARRLEAERRILARLSHPHIARFIDAGIDDSGSPWLALEYVEGIDLNQWCDQRRPPLAERLQLFLQLCSAVEHAHRLLVVHRDIKPSNVLVEADGRPRLLDFGVAKLLDAAVGELTAAAFTPAYAAPEQLRGGEVSTATDVYALGLLLFRLLAGGLPDTRSDPSLPAVLARLDEEETRQPSKAAVAHAASLPYAPAVLAGDLDAIVSKAIRARPEDRYGSVVELAADVRRHLAARPVAARAPTRAYRLARWLRRNRVAAALGAAAALAVLAGLGASLWLAQREAEAARRANAEAARAERVKRFVLSVFSEYDPVARAAIEANPSALVAEGIARAEQELADDPRLKRAVLADLGLMEAKLGDAVQAVQRLEALDASMGDDDPLAHARVRLALADAQLLASRLPDAQRALAAARPVIEQLGADDVERLRADILAARLAYMLGDFAGAIEGAKATYPRSVALLGETHAETIGQLILLGTWQTAAAQFADGEKTLNDAVALIERARGPEHPLLAYTLMQIGNSYRRQQRFVDALPFLERADRILSKALPAGHRRVGDNLMIYADTLRSAGRVDEAEAVATRVAPTVRDGSLEYALLCMLRGQIATSRGRHEDAAVQFHSAFLAYRANLGDKNPNVWGARGEEGRALLEAGDVAKAARILEEVQAMRRQHLPPESLDHAHSQRLIGNLRAAQGRGDEALAAWRTALAGYERTFGPAHARCISLRRTIVGHLVAARDAAPAEARAEVDALIALEDGLQARGWSALLAARAGDPARAAQDLERARAIAAATPEAPRTAALQAWLDGGDPGAIAPR